MKYEYKVLHSDKTAHAEERELNELGDDGWELVSATSDPDGTVLLYLKRPRS